MSAHVLLNLLNGSGKRDKMRVVVYQFYCMALFFSQTQRHMIKWVINFSYHWHSLKTNQSQYVSYQNCFFIFISPTLKIYIKDNYNKKEKHFYFTIVLFSFSPRIIFSMHFPFQHLFASRHYHCFTLLTTS